MTICYISLLHLERQAYLKHIIGERYLGLSLFQNDQLFDRMINTVVAPGPLSHSLSLYACIYALYTGRTFIDSDILKPSV